MTLIHSREALRNIPLILNVEAVVYVEGGVKNYTVKDAYRGVCGSDAIDITFWDKMFSYFTDYKKIKTLCVGSKTTLKQIGSDLLKEREINVYVAMDRDYDNYKNELLNHPNIIYTRGYSWENDIWQEEVVLKIIQTLSGSAALDVAVKTEVGNLYNILNSSVVSRFVRIDLLLQLAGGECSIRNGPTCKGFVTGGNKNKPSFNKARLKKSISDVRSLREKSIVLNKNIKPKSLLDCYGKLLACYCYKLVTYILHKKNVKPGDKKCVSAIAIEKYFSLLKSGSLPSLDRYYRGKLSR